jgi:hypothetical protein
MFERFTDQGRRVLVLAQDEARLLNHNFIGTEHILLGLLHEGDGLAAQALGSLGIGLQVVREKVDQTVGPAGKSLTGSAPFTPRSKKVLELSLREALQLGHGYIGTEHILLGLVREGEGVGAQVLVSMGADPVDVRQRVLQVMAGSPAQDPTKPGVAWSAGAPAPAPRCGRCGASLSESARYRSLDALPGDGEDAGNGPISVTVLYCGQCGTVLGPALERATALKAPLQATVHVRPLSGANPPSRRFPDDLLGPVRLDDVADEARVELFYRDDDVIEGTVARAGVRMTSQVRSRQGPLRGTWAAWPSGGALATSSGYLPAGPRARSQDGWETTR